ncbi:interferon a3-like isoform X3 [Oncorhynchus keta]|uniref:interferon a3-like isoform X2 n=1 Tax=Oncorhynchus keta TaxID=8018 RepID=UPI00227D051C|nr:interferon a3-like isoform X2 [Oncorhynchus keta]XP_052374556.1 interferon a3-like isoform X3 [Oncorhynchus keta]
MMPTPASDASTSTMNAKEGSGCANTGASVNNAFRRPNTMSASAAHRKRTGPPFSSEGHEVSRGPQITFPDKQYRQVNKFKADEQIAFISHTLNAIKKLYSSGKYESTAWDQKGVDKFMNDLYRQTSELDQCVKAMKTRLSKSVNRVNKKMSLHFKFLKHYLKREDYSASGWEDIRTVVLAHLQRLDTTLSSQ